MKYFSMFFLIFATLPLSVFSQSQEEDIILLKNGSIFRGTITDKITPGGTITITPNGRQAIALYWSEIALIRRWPVEIPDSVVIKSFLKRQPEGKPGQAVVTIEPPAREPAFSFKEYRNEEDVVFLVDGTLLRGIVLNQRNDGSVSLWRGGEWKDIGGPAVTKYVHVETGIPDSTLNMMYIDSPRRFREAESRLFSVHAGMTFTGGEFAKPTDRGGNPTKSGYAVGIDFGFRVLPGFRWLTSFTYSHHLRENPVVLEDVYVTDASAQPCNIYNLITGVEGRISGPGEVQVHGAVQGGLITMSAGDFRMELPQTYYHLPGNLRIAGYSTSSFSFSGMIGIMFRRLSFDVRWTTFKPEYTTSTELMYIYNIKQTFEHAVDTRVNLITCTIGVSIY